MCPLLHGILKFPKKKGPGCGGSPEPHPHF